MASIEEEKPEHHLIDDRRGDKVEDKAVDDGVHVVEHQTVGHNDSQRRRKGDVAKGQVRVLDLTAIVIKSIPPVLEFCM